MKLKKYIKILVIKTNPYWPFSLLNRLPYHIAVKAFLRDCKRFREIKSVYVRHGFVQPNWVPGISDIDFTLIVDSGLKTEDEFSFLEAFWKSFLRLKAVFPMLGEISILDDQIIKSWTKFTIRGYEAKEWKLVYGDETVSYNYVINKNKLRNDTINHAFTIYLEHFLYRFYNRRQPRFLTLKELHRLVDKILRYANKHNANTESTWTGRGEYNDRFEMLCDVIKSLEENTKHFSWQNMPAGANEDMNTWLKNFGSQKACAGKDQCYSNELARFDELIDSVILSGTANFIILKDKLPEVAIKECMKKIYHFAAQHNTMLIVVTACMFKYMVRFYTPYQYSQLLRHGKVALGNDPLESVQPPDRYFFIKSVLEQSINVFSYPRSQRFFVAQDSRTAAYKEIISNLYRSLVLKLYLEKNIITPRYDENIAKCKEFFTEEFNRIPESSNVPECNESRTARLDLFSLFKEMTNDIHNAIANSRGSGLA